MSSTTMETKNPLKRSQRHRIVLRTWRKPTRNYLVGPWRKTRDEAEQDRAGLVERYLPPKTHRKTPEIQ